MSDNDILFWRMFALFQHLPEVPPPQILMWLSGDGADAALTPARLATLVPEQLEASFPADLTIMSAARWQRVIGCLRGELPVHLRVHKPAGREAQLRVAFCSQDGLAINGHFGQCRLFFVYAFDEQGAWLEGLRRYPSAPQEMEANEVRARLLADCHLLFCEAIGGPAAARLIRHNVHPMKVAAGHTILSQNAAILTLLAGQLPPWLAKRLQRTNPLEDRVF